MVDEGNWRKSFEQPLALMQAGGGEEHNHGTTTARHTQQLGCKCCRLACVHAPVSVVVERQSERWQKKEEEPFGYLEVIINCINSLSSALPVSLVVFARRLLLRFIHHALTPFTRPRR